MARKYNRHPEDAKLWKAIEEMDAQMEAEGIEDATAWPLFGEYESILYTIAERSVERESRWHDETDELIEFVELAEEDARCQLNIFGCLEFEPQFDWSRKSTPDERGWSRAVLDIIDFEGAADAESLFELM